MVHASATETFMVKADEMIKMRISGISILCRRTVCDIGLQGEARVIRTGCCYVATTVMCRAILRVLPQGRRRCAKKKKECAMVTLT